MPDITNPAPEPTWKYRRIYTYGLTAAVCVGIVIALAFRANTVALALTALLALLATYYMIAPSAEHIVATVQAWKAQR